MTSLSLSRLFGSLTVALVCGLFISYIYHITYRGTSYSSSYVRSLAIFTMITSVVIMVIGNNLARAFGLVGSMSIVRFRMAIKDTQDIVFIFFSLAIGMAAGVGQHLVAINSTIFIGLVILVLAKIDYAAPHKREFLLQFHFSSEDDDYTPYIDVLKQFCRKYKLINIKSIGDSIVELAYYVTLKKNEQSKKLINQLGRIEEVSNVNLFFDEE